MPIYKFDLTVEIDADDIDWVNSTLDDIAYIDGLDIVSKSPHSSNPADYPDDWDDDDEDNDFDDD